MIGCEALKARFKHWPDAMPRGLPVRSIETRLRRYYLLYIRSLGRLPQARIDDAPLALRYSAEIFSSIFSRAFARLRRSFLVRLMMPLRAIFSRIGSISSLMSCSGLM